ncbi:ubiquitin carboxyl-terminal hydrolase 44-like [Physeter macrocephalus]|uniref:ubiquitinyl hydrolase 1 n=1 Tax=Physeter macrocephalus TaxID=9755 RepID=A0A9W2WA73_PHYMC|nr:ubiquitin carboxyl-terminal hydrolase 44-like [Physeter catodon]
MNTHRGEARGVFGSSCLGGFIDPTDGYSSPGYRDENDNAQKWHCVDCSTAESIWACLSCSHVACGRYVEEHALKHFQESSHPVALEVNEVYVFCYLCDDYVLNDNAIGDLKLLRSTLSAIKSQNDHCTTRSGRVLRSMGTSDDSYFLHDGTQSLLQNEDQMYTALWHRRRILMGKIFRTWFEQSPTGRKRQEQFQQKIAKREVKKRRKLIRQVLHVVNNIFHGQLLSQVTCLACDNKSNTIEPFWDLSLEFPERYQCSGKDIASQPCLVTEMLAKFTETEALEGKIYVCDQCNSKRRRFSSKPVVLTEAQKQLMICHLPQVLRLHLKRFRWSGLNNREKIGVHVGFEEILNVEPYCCRKSLKSLRPECFLYDLSAVVMHHGKGFGSGHYTAHCYNSEGGFWVHCNDSKLSMCPMDEVCNAQAYILFHTQRVTENGHSKLLPPELLSGSQHPNEEADASSNEILS